MGFKKLVVNALAFRPVSNGFTGGGGRGSALGARGV